ncbi:MAG: aldose epimerase family protein [Janthinobacterium lividum]
MSATRAVEPFGALPDGRSVERWTLRNRHGLVVRFISYGGAITELLLPDRNGTVENVVLRFADLADYLGQPGQARPYFGALIGRYGNRIADARFTLDGMTHRLAANEGRNILHGGPDGFDRQIWAVAPAPERPGEVGAVLSLTSPAGSNGFPGRLTVRVGYTLTDDNELRLEYGASTDAPTVVNLTNHSYFNLGGDLSGTVDRHHVAIAADHYLPVDAGLIPDGPPAPVAGTPFDLRRPLTIREVLVQPHPQLLRARGIDHCWMLRGGTGPAALVYHRDTGRWLRCFTTQPALQFYTGNFLDGTLPGRTGAAYRQGAGFALETQHPPDSPNRPDFPSTRLDPGEQRSWSTVFGFGVSDCMPDWPD